MVGFSAVNHHKKHNLNEDKDHVKQHLILNYSDSTLGWQDPSEVWNVIFNAGEEPYWSFATEGITFKQATAGDIVSFLYKNSQKAMATFAADVEIEDNLKLYLTTIDNLTSPANPVIYADPSTHFMYFDTSNSIDSAEMHFGVGETGFYYFDAAGGTDTQLLLGMEEGRMEFHDGSSNGCFFTSSGQCNFLGQFARFNLASSGTPTTQGSAWYANVTSPAAVWTIDNSGTGPAIKIEGSGNANIETEGMGKFGDWIQVYDGGLSGNKVLETDSANTKIAADALSYYAGADMDGTVLWSIDDTGIMTLGNGTSSSTLIYDNANSRFEAGDMVYAPSFRANQMVFFNPTDTAPLAGNYALLYSNSNSRFQLNDSLYVDGDLVFTGTITGDVNPVISADEWLYFNNPTNDKGIRWNSSGSYFEVGGPLILGSESYYFAAGQTTGDETIIKANAVDAFPYISIEGLSDVTHTLQNGTGQFFQIQDSSITPSVYFKVTEGGNVTIPTGNLVLSNDLYAQNGETRLGGLLEMTDGATGTFELTSDNPFDGFNCNKSMYSAGDILLGAGKKISFNTSGSGTPVLDGTIGWNATNSTIQFDDNTDHPSGVYAKFNNEMSLGYTGSQYQLDLGGNVFYMPNCSDLYLDGANLHFDTSGNYNISENTTNDDIRVNKTFRVGNLASAPSTPINGQIYYNTTDNKFKLYENGSWVEVVQSDAVTSVFGRTGDVVATSNDYTWAQIDKTTSSLADITTRAISDTTGTLAIARGGTGKTALENVTAGSSKITLGGTPTGSVVNAFSIDVNEANLTLDNIGGTLSETHGGTNQTTYTTGDLLYASASNTLSKLAVGTADQVLTVSGGVPTWQDAASGSPLTTKGDLYTYDTADARLPVGTNDYALIADSAETTGLKWAAIVNSFNSRTGAVTPQANDYTWAQIDKTTSDLADLTTKQHSDLTNLTWATAGHTIAGDTAVDFNNGGTAKTLHYDTTDTRFEFNDKLKVPNARIGGDTNYTEFDTDGHQTMAGTARVYKCIQFYPYNIGGLAGTYNGVACGASGLGSLNGIYFKTFDDGSGAGTAEAANISFDLPTDYVDGTDLLICFDMTVGTTATTDVRWQCGETHVSDGDTFSPSTYTWATPQNVAGPGTSWERKNVNFTLSGTGMLKGDEVSVVIFRDATNAADTYTGDAYFSDVKIRYLSDRVGEKST